MKTDELRLLPHELAFGFFLILTLVRLIQAEGILGPHTLWLLILLAASGFVAWRAAPRPRLVFYAVVVQALYFLIRSIVDVIHPLREDALLERADLLLFGFNPNLALERFSWPLLSDVMSAQNSA